MPIKKCSENGQSGWQWGSGKCFIGEKGKEEAIKQAIAIGKGKMPEDSDYEILDDDLIIEDAEKKVMGFIPPSYPENMPKEAVTILTHTYANIRGQWVKEHPSDPENQGNKIKAASIAWSAVEKAGYKKNKEGNYVKSDALDADWYHVAIVRNIEEFEGGSFENERLEGNGFEGIWIRKGSLKDDILGTKVPYRFEFDIYQFTAQQAKDYLKNEGLEYIKFVPAIKKVEDNNNLNLTNLHLDVFDSTRQLLTTNVIRTNEGYLKGRAIVTNTGIFNYLVDGKVVKELRDNDEVFKEDSLNSLKNKPITDGHPKEMVNSDNIKKYQVGFTGSDVQKDGHAVSIDYIITDKEMIRKIDAGEKRAFSCGYNANLDYDVANKYFFGNNPVDCRQKDILYNHVAVVERGRAGDLAQLPMRIDSMNNFLIHTQIIDNSTKEDTMGNTTIKIDGIDFSVENSIAKHIFDLENIIKKGDEDLKAIQGKLTEAEAKRDAFENEVKTLKEDQSKQTLLDAEIQAKVKETIELQKIADHVKVKYDDNTSIENLKLNIIKTKNDKFSLEGKQDGYLDSYFDAVKDSILKDMATAPANNNKKKTDSVYVENTQPQIKTSKQDMYDAYKEKLIKQSQEYKGAVSVN